MMTPHIKICGLTRVEDALLALESGASALGMILFYEKSPRCATIEQARAITSSLGGLAHTVAVMVNPGVAQVEQAIRELKVNTLQFHGDESPAFCEQFNVPYFKVIRVKPDQTLEEDIQPYRRARGILLDTYIPDVVGGTGKAFDWSLAASLDDPRLIVAGGLAADNIAAAARLSGARAFDVASGVESAPGIKDPVKLRALFEAVRAINV